MAEQALVVFLVALCAWRMAFAISQEKIFAGLRRRLGEEIIPLHTKNIGNQTIVYENYVTFPDNFINNLLHCVRCLSFWCAAIALGIWQVFPPIVIVFAVSALAILIDNLYSFLGTNDGN